MSANLSDRRRFILRISATVAIAVVLAGKICPDLFGYFVEFGWALNTTFWIWADA